MCSRPRPSEVAHPNGRPTDTLNTYPRRLYAGILPDVVLAHSDIAKRNPINHGAPVQR
jgi:hypothetical protein